MKFLKIIAALFTCAAALPVAAQEVDTIAPGKMGRIDRFNVCRYVTNNGAASIMVPSSITAEWSSGVAAFLQNTATMDRVSVARCEDVWDGLRGPTKTIQMRGNYRQERIAVSNASVTWQDGTTTATMFAVNTNGYTGAGIRDMKHGAQVGSLPPTLYYNAETGACAPAKSFLGVGPFRSVSDVTESTDNEFWDYEHTFTIHVQLCDSDGVATRPFLGVTTSSPQNPPYDMPHLPLAGTRTVNAPIASFDRR